MGSAKERLNCAEVNGMDLVEYLGSLGFTPAKIRGSNYWYLSPLRIEHTASFKVNRSLNRWYDFGIGKGGSVVDFGILYFNCTVSTLLNSFQNAILPDQKSDAYIEDSNPKLIITSVAPLRATSLIQYLAARAIPYQLATNYCQQVSYTLNDKKYYGIGFPNDAGGFEIRNPFFKSCSSPKAITTFRRGFTTLSVFEGFLDFLSFLRLFEGTVALETDYLILNSLSFFEQQMEHMLSYSKVFLYLDNDKAGKHCTVAACKQNSAFIGNGHLYRNFKDLNDLLIGNSFPPTSGDGLVPRLP